MVIGHLIKIHLLTNVLSVHNNVGWVNKWELDIFQWLSPGLRYTAYCPDSTRKTTRSEQPEDSTHAKRRLQRRETFRDDKTQRPVGDVNDGGGCASRARREDLWDEQTRNRAEAERERQHVDDQGEQAQPAEARVERM